MVPTVSSMDLATSLCRVLVRISLVIAPCLSLFGRLVLLGVSSLLVPRSLAGAQPLRRYSRFFF
ncbi:hypothetical protein M404DRAFT_1007023, partial [Pisolithus tinctorius Marx 270]